MNTWIELFILAFASFRLTHLIVYDDITEWLRKPFISIVSTKDEHGTTNQFREPKGKGIRRWLGLVLSCHWCTGIWCAALLTALQFYVPAAYPLITLLAIAAIASFIETYLLYLLRKR